MESGCSQSDDQHIELGRIGGLKKMSFDLKLETYSDSFIYSGSRFHSLGPITEKDLDEDLE